MLVPLASSSEPVPPPEQMKHTVLVSSQWVFPSGLEAPWRLGGWLTSLMIPAPGIVPGS